MKSCFLTPKRYRFGLQPQAGQAIGGSLFSAVISFISPYQTTADAEMPTAAAAGVEGLKVLSR